MVIFFFKDNKVQNTHNMVVMMVNNNNDDGNANNNDICFKCFAGMNIHMPKLLKLIFLLFIIKSSSSFHIMLCVCCLDGTVLYLCIEYHI